MGGFHSHGDTSQWMVYDGKTLTKMDENWGYPMTQETSQDVFPPGTAFDPSRTGKAGATDSPFLSPQKNRHESQNFVRLYPLEPLETDTVIPWKKMCCSFFRGFDLLTYSHFTSGAYVWLADPLFLGHNDINDPIIQAVESTMLINQQQYIPIYDVNIC